LTMPPLPLVRASGQMAAPAGAGLDRKV
jgi:hypothetical protein